jgi:hypothetical protein
MTDLLFDTPWWLPALIAAVGVVLFVTGNNRLEAKVKAAGLAAVGLAVLLMAVSYFVDTAKESAERRTRELVDAFERADWPAMTAILDPSATVSLLGAPIYRGRDQIIEKAKTAHSDRGFKSVRVLTADTDQVDTVITVTVTLLSEQDAIASTVNSNWHFQWQETADGWALVEVRAIQIGQFSGEQIRSLFPGR